LTGNDERLGPAERCAIPPDTSSVERAAALSSPHRCSSQKVMQDDFFSCEMLYYASYCSILQDFITMHKTARQKYLVDLISENGQVSISELVEKLQVSADTLPRSGRS
jgi:hypothetical protein